jgi:hypothetical protein
MTHDVEKFQPLEVILGQEVINIATILQIVKAAGHGAVRTALGGGGAADKNRKSLRPRRVSVGQINRLYTDLCIENSFL